MRRIFMVLAMTLMLAACGSSSSSADSAAGSDIGYEMAPAMPEAVNSDAMSKDASMPMPGSSGTGSTDPLKPGERLVVRDASLVLQVSDVNAVVNGRGGGCGRRRHGCQSLGRAKNTSGV